MAEPTLVRTLERIHVRTGRYPHECFRAFVRLAACAVSAGRREAEYMEEAGRWQQEDLEDFARAFGLMVEQMEAGQPFGDLLGPIHMEWGSQSGKAAGGEFYTPWALAEAMAQVNLGDASFPEHRPITVMEPACGSGIMVLALAKVLQKRGVSPRRMRAVMRDVSPTAVDMAYVQTTLWGIPALVIHGNALSGEEWGRWPTIWWTTPREWLGEADPIEATEPTPEPTTVVLGDKGQYAMDLFQEAA